MRLRGAIRNGTFQLSEEGEALQQMKAERELREQKKAEKAKITNEKLDQDKKRKHPEVLNSRAIKTQIAPAVKAVPQGGA